MTISVTTDNTEKSIDKNEEATEKLFIESYVEELQERLTTKGALRITNQNAQNVRPSESYFSTLDSNLKRNTTFVKKIRNFSSSQVDAYLKDMSVLNLTKYISEISAAIVDTKLKMSDVSAIIKMCCALHQTYAEFSQFLFENWQKLLSFKVSDKIVNPSKLRVDIRFYAELLNIGLFNNKNAFGLLGNVLTTLINMDKEDHLNIAILLSFCRHCGEEYAGLVSRKVRELSEKYGKTIPKSDFLPIEKQENVKMLLKDYYASLCKHLLKDHLEILDYERHNFKILQTKGELNQERKDKLEAMQNSFDKLFTNTQNLAELLDESLPELKENKFLKEDEGLVITSAGYPVDGSTTSFDTLWYDSETQRFYCDLPELQTYLPTSMINKARPKPEENSEVTEEILDLELTPEEVDEESKILEEPQPPEDDPEEASTVTVSNKILIESFLNNLPNCVNREMIDNAAIDFLVTLNTKHNRKKLIRALFGVNRTRLDLLPFYGRFVAILYPALPEIGNDLCHMLRQDFKYHVRKKDQINIESKIKVVRYIGELVKFNLYSKIDALYCLKVLLHDFSHHHIEMACNLLEVCGHFLYCHIDSRQRTKVYLEQMMRKKAVMALDSRYVTQIENAYYYVNPPEMVAVTKKERPPMHQFIRKLLYQDLQKNNIDKILRLIRKLNWNEKEIFDYTIKCLIGAHNVKYFNIRCLASLLSGLVAYQEELGTRVVDGVLEDIRLGMEVNLPKFNQRRVAQVKYLGELYNYKIVESSDIFKVLYSLISFGVSTDPDIPSILDPPNHLFRIRLSCTLLEACGMYFSSGSSKKKLDYFLIFLQAYYWYKRKIWAEAFPPTLEHIFKDTISQLRPKLKLCTSFEETQTQIDKIRTSLGIDRLTGDASFDLSTNEDNSSSGNAVSVLEAIVEAENEGEQAEEDVSEALTGPITEDETPTEDETVDHTQGSDEEGDRDLSDTERPQDDDDDDPLRKSASEGTAPILSSHNETASQESNAIPSAPRRLTCPEDDEFLNALDRMVSENIQERMRDQSLKAPVNVDISVPLVARSGGAGAFGGGDKKSYDQLQSTDMKDKNTMGFVLMLRKGNKQQYKTFEADVNSELAQNLRDQELAQREEKLKVKRLTLNITERFEEEDYQEMLQQQRPVTQNLNRERKKYHHPKGAPDADLIFGKRAK